MLLKVLRLLANVHHAADVVKNNLGFFLTKSGNNRDVPRTNTKKEQVNARVPIEVVEYIDQMEARTGLSRTRRVLAGLVAFECLAIGPRETVTEWASALEAGVVSWQDLLDHVAKAKAAALDHKKLQRMLDLLKEQRNASTNQRPA